MARYYECDMCERRNAFKPAYTVKIKHNDGTDDVDIYHLCGVCYDKVMRKLEEVKNDKI